MAQKRSEVLVVIWITMLFGSYFVGLSIKNIRLSMASSSRPSQTLEIVQVQEANTNRVRRRSPEIQYSYTPESQPQWQDEIEPEPEELPEVAWDDQDYEQWDDQWENSIDQFGINLNENLNDRQINRLRQGIRTGLQRFQNMSPQEQEAALRQFENMQQEFMNLPEQNRQLIIEELQSQFNQWFQDGQ